MRITKAGKVQFTKKEKAVMAQKGGWGLAANYLRNQAKSLEALHGLTCEWQPRKPASPGWPEG